jgi:uncharacterized membrane protein YraQ (UPF0718 family)
MKKIMNSNIFWPTVVMFLIAVALFVVASLQGGSKNIAGLKSAWGMTWQILPLLLFAFVTAGLVQVLIPREVIAEWVGDESGIRGILIGTLAGAFTPGGPYVSLPVAAGLLKAGAGMGTMVAFLASWSLIAVSRLPLQIGIMGWRFTLIQLVSVMIFPPIAGLIANLLVKWIK